MNLEKIFALKDVNLMKDLFDKNKQLFKFLFLHFSG